MQPQIQPPGNEVRGGCCGNAWLQGPHLLRTSGEVLLPERAGRYARELGLPGGADRLAVTAPGLKQLALALADRRETCLVHRADRALLARGIKIHDGATTSGIPFERCGAILHRVAGARTQQEVGKVVLVVRQRGNQLAPQSGMELHGPAGEHGLGNTRLREHPRIHLPHGHNLLVPATVGHHERAAVGLLEELRALKVVREAVQHELGGRVVEVAQLLAHVAAKAQDEQALVGAVVHSDHGQEVARVLVAVDRGAEPALEALVPHADAIHAHVDGLVARSELDVVAADEERHGKAVRADGGGGDAAEPPRAVRTRDLDVLALVSADVEQARNVVVALHLGVNSRGVYKRDVLELARGMLEREHRPVEERISVRSARERQQVERADEALGDDAHVVVHHEDVREGALDLGGGHHAARETAGSAHVGVRQNGDEVVGERIDVERATVIHDEHMEITHDGRTLGTNGLLDEVDVGRDVGFLLEGGGGDGEAHLVDLGRIDLAGPPGASDGDGVAAGGLDGESDKVHVIRRDRDVQDGRSLQGARELVRADDRAFGIGPGGLGIGVDRSGGGNALDAQVAGACEFDVEHGIPYARVTAPLPYRQAVEVREEVNGCAADEGTGLRVDGRRAGGRAIVELRMLCSVIVDIQQNVLKLEGNGHVGSPLWWIRAVSAGTKSWFILARARASHPGGTEDGTE